MSTKKAREFVKKWETALNITDVLQADSIPPAEKGLRQSLTLTSELVDIKAFVANRRAMVGYDIDPELDQAFVHITDILSALEESQKEVDEIKRIMTAIGLLAIC